MRRVVEISYSPLRWTDASGRVKVYDVDVPEPLFRAMLERAARHRGYAPSSQDLHAYTNDAARFELTIDPEGSAPPVGRVWRSTLLEEREIPGTPLVERVYSRTHPLPLYMFSCNGGAGTASTKARRLILRVHKRARLVFEVVTIPAGADADATIDAVAGAGGAGAQGGRKHESIARRVRIEIECDRETGDGTSRSLDADTRRTVENTIQVVFLGQNPKRASFLANPKRPDPARAGAGGRRGP